MISVYIFHQNWSLINLQIYFFTLRNSCTFLSPPVHMHGGLLCIAFHLSVTWPKLTRQKTISLEVLKLRSQHSNEYEVRNTGRWAHIKVKLLDLSSVTAKLNFVQPWSHSSPLIFRTHSDSALHQSAMGAPNNSNQTFTNVNTPPTHRRCKYQIQAIFVYRDQWTLGPTWIPGKAHFCISAAINLLE